MSTSCFLQLGERESNNGMDLLKTLIVASEKAANIARLLRENEQLFEKLVEQKSLAEANPRFQDDFKTLADVLIQEMVKHLVASKFPLIQVQGEESNHFYSKLLEKKVVIEVRCKNDTVALLAELLDEKVAHILAEEIFKDLSTVNTPVLPNEEFSVDVDKLGIWIDPIDGTNEYVKGGFEAKQGDFYVKGLKCVTVLIGVYNDQGQPVMGVVNQPFFQPEIDIGFQCHWGIYHQTPGKSIASVNLERSTESNVICVGGTEDPSVIQTLESAGFNLVASRGAGYKLLTVVLGFADAYVLSKPTTYFWDTCGPHAILKALGGDIVEMTSLKLKNRVPISYTSATNCHVYGIVAYRNPKVLQKLLNLDWKVE